jgi:Family of unknown function (DUF6152)
MRTVASILALSFAWAVSPAFAHHSFDAEYDAAKTATLTGIVTNVEWINPHAFITVSLKDESGVTKEFKVELGPPYALTRGGWKRDTVKIGDKITMQDTALAKDGSNRAGSTQNTFLILGNGQKLPMR